MDIILVALILGSLIGGCGSAMIGDIPRISKHLPLSVTVSEGGKARLICPVEATPRPLISWKKNNEDILVGTEDRVSARGRRLVIRDAIQIDSGIYICKAVNGFGSIHVALELKVISKNVHDENVTSYIQSTMPNNAATTTVNIVELIRQMASEEFITSTVPQMATEDRRSEYIRQMSSETAVSEPIHQMAADDRQSRPIRQMTASPPQSERIDHVATAFGVIVPLVLVIVSILVFVSLVLLVSLLILPRHGQLNESQRVASQESVIPPQEDLDQIDIPAPLPNPNWVLAGFFLHMAQNNIDSGYESASTM